MKFFKILLFFIAISSALSVNAQTTSEQLKRQREKLTDQLEQLTREYNQTLNDKRSTIKQINILKAKINLGQQKIDNINADVRNLNNRIAENTSTVHSLQDQLTQLRKEYEAMVLFAYRNKSGYNKLMFIFAAKDFNQAYKRLKYLQEFAAYRKRQAEYIESKQKDLNVKIVQLDKTKEEKHSLLIEQQKEKDNLGKERSTQQSVVSTLSKQEGQLKAAQRDVQKRIAASNRAISAAINREIAEARRKAEEAEKAERAAAAAKAKAANKDAPAAAPVVRKTTADVLNSTPEAARLSNDFLGNRGRLPWPVAKGIPIQGFGVYYSEGIQNNNDGIDIRTSPGSSVRAVFDGEVTKVLDILGTYIVVIKHGEYFTAYSNLKNISVSNGQKVSTKQSIGSAATDGATGETVISFKLYKGSTAVNPEIWLSNR